MKLILKLDLGTVQNITKTVEIVLNHYLRRKRNEVSKL